MNKLIGGVALLCLAVGGATSANAAAWCAYYDFSTYNCGFHTFEQCLQNIRGVGGYCSPNYLQGNSSQRQSGGKRIRDNRWQ